MTGAAATGQQGLQFYYKHIFFRVIEYLGFPWKRFPANVRHKRVSFPVLLLFHSLVYMEYLVDSLLHFSFFLHSEYVLAEHFLYSRERFLSAFSRSLYEQGITHRGWNGGRVSKVFSKSELKI